MISPKAVRLIIRHLDAVDECVAGHLVRKRPWSEPALTSLLCDLMDQETQNQESIRYNLEELNHDLEELDGLLSLSFEIQTHEYEPTIERWVTQSDLGFVITYHDYLLPNRSWRSAWLLQAKRLYPDVRNPLAYSEISAFTAYDTEQHKRMRVLTELVGINFVRYLLYCPRPSMLDNETEVKLTHLRNINLGSHIFDYTVGLVLHDELSSRDSSLAAGLHVTDSLDIPGNLGAVHAGMFAECMPLSWFFINHLVAEPISHGSRPSVCRRDPGMPFDPYGGGPDWAEGIVCGDSDAVERVIDALGDNEKGPFRFLPPHTLKVEISVGHNFRDESKAIRHKR